LIRLAVRRTRQLLRRLLGRSKKREPSIIFDVGSRNGRQFLQRCRNEPTTQVYAFEPEPASFQSVLDNTRGLPNFHAFPLAVTTQDGECDLRVSAVTGNHSLHDFVSGVNEVWKYPYEKDLPFEIPDFAVVDTVKVQTTRLDSFIDRMGIPYISYLHIDAQGEDLNVLRSLGRHAAIVRAGVIEVCTKPLYVGHFTKQEALDCLAELGFVVSRVQVEHFGLVENLYFERPLAAARRNVSGR
jgi:FkbM family methyltransferase